MKSVHIITYILIFEKIILTINFSIYGEKHLISIPSVAFRHRPNAFELTANAKPEDDWILYVQGKTLFHIKYYPNRRNIFISGWFFQENRFRKRIAMSTLSAVVDDVDKTRVTYFTASGKKNKMLCINSTTVEMCARTDKNGLIKKTFQLSNKDVETLRVPGGTYGKIEYLVSALDENIRVKGEVFLCDDNGISIISDIVSYT